MNIQTLEDSPNIMSATLEDLPDINSQTLEDSPNDFWYILFEIIFPNKPKDLQSCHILHIAKTVCGNNIQIYINRKSKQ